MYSRLQLDSTVDQVATSGHSRTGTGRFSVNQLTDIAGKLNTVIMAGLFERDEAQSIYNCYVTVGPDVFIAKFRKLHPFVNPHLSAGNDFRVIDLLGCRIGFLICYDNNLIENVWITAMLGAEIIFMPHVTCCHP